MSRTAWIVGIDDWSSASPRSAFTLCRNRLPAVVWSFGSSYTSIRVENLETEKNMALRRSLEKYFPAHAMSLVKTEVISIDAAAVTYEDDTISETQNVVDSNEERGGASPGRG